VLVATGQSTGWSAVLGGMAVAAVGVLLLVYRSKVQTFWEEKAFPRFPEALRDPAYRTMTYVVGPIFVVVVGLGLFISGVVSLFR
jgi:LPXTG-motif cell wall-anchored protein